MQVKTQGRTPDRQSGRCKSNTNRALRVGLLAALGTVLLSLWAIASIWQGPLEAPRQSPTLPPREFFITTAWRDDFYPYWQATVTHAVQQVDAALVTHLYVQSSTQPCDEPDLKGAQRLLPRTRIEALAGSLDLCALDPMKINGFARKYIRQPKAFETARVGIVATCGATVKVFELPKYEMNEALLQRKSPETLRLLHLGEQVLNAAFGSEQSTNLLSQNVGVEQLATLKGDEFRAGFWFCSPDQHRGIPAEIGTTADEALGGECDWARLKMVLTKYKRAPRGAREVHARLVDSGGFKLLTYVAPVYRFFQQRQRLAGPVQLSLDVDQETGFVNEVSVTSGPDDLRSYVIDAAKRWRFDPQQKISSPVKSTVEFPPPCEDNVP